MSYKKEYWTSEQVSKFFTELRDASLIDDDTETYHIDSTGVCGVPHTDSGGYVFVNEENELKDWKIADSGVVVVICPKWESSLNERLKELSQE